ncbi:MAG: UDP-N-acetylmuramoyl-L-alanyl-D-glutamate--2,6-diaminopimelate ligase, partial [Candidatus Coatesbacteria bacterium]|nr:UDP-N-acetylmuramoyl-L-alanyl-D-glutamate--2,6-diaminopimelate ligase [Candidatus Coatesbacteria bacterium]
MRFAELMKDVKILSQFGDDAVEVTGLSCSSSDVPRSGAFFAQRGTSVDGHEYVEEAICSGAGALVIDRQDVFLRLREVLKENGPVVALVENTRAALAVAASNYYGRPTWAFDLIGIVGTNGKTSVSYLLESILSIKSRVGVIGTISYRYPGCESRASLTTPDPVLLQKLFAEMRDAGVEHVVLETSSHGIAQHRIDGCRFKVGIFTNITQDHLDFHGTFDEYLGAKLSFFERHLEPIESDGVKAVINLDGPNAGKFIATSKVETLTFSTSNPEADYLAYDIQITGDGTFFVVRTPKGALEVKSSLIGAHSVENCLAAIAASYGLGLNSEQIASGIAS